MGRDGHPFYYESRAGWYASIHGKQNQKVLKGPNDAETKKLAYAKYYQLIGQSPELFAASKDSVAKICELFLEDVSANKSEATWSWFNQRITSFLAEHPSLMMKELKPFHVTKWVNKNKTSSATTRRNKITAIKRVCKWATAQGYIEANPLAELVGVAAGTRDSYVSVDEFKELIHFVRDENFKDLLTVTFSCGGRPQELLRVEARHFTKDKERNFILKFPIKESKGKKRNRIIRLKPDALKIIEKSIKKYPSGPLFRNSNGEAWNPSSCGNQFSRLQIRMAKTKMRALGLTPKPKLTFKQELKQAKKYQKRFCLYDFRHGFAQAGLESGVDSVIIGALMGHKDRSMVAKIYSHPDEKPEFLQRELLKVKTTGAKK